ncbi:MAG: 16S rRNA (cytidine1402-2'-O)-methyltransferase [Bacteriovoracaceae bacterium]|jgi:16S rRNA (cytidine1402-2'-O)-methyltransferase
MKGTLTLIPTPIDDNSPLCIRARMILELAVKKKQVILVEEIKAGRRRWLHFGLPREAIEDFILYNEHTRDELNTEQTIS